MIPPDMSVLEFVKDFLWAPLLGLIAWAWSRNQKEHDDMRAAHDKLMSGTSVGHSVLNDRIMVYVDTAAAEMRDEQTRISDKAAAHIAKLFENAERDRKDFHDQIDAMRKDSFARHIELMSAIHGKADK